MINFEKYLVNKNSELMSALNILNNLTHKVLIIVDDNKKLCGTISDGDLRRWVIRKDSKANCESLMNANCIYAYSHNKEIMKSKAKKKGVSLLPLIDDENKVIGVCEIELRLSEKKKSTAVIMAGGKGTRLLPLTKDVPKPLIEVGGKAIIERIIEKLINEGFQNIVISVGHLSGLIEEYVKGKDFDASISFSRENKPLGTAGSLADIKKRDIFYPILVTNADILCECNLSNIVEKTMDQNLDGIMLCKEEKYQVPFGVINHNNKEWKGITEKPTYSFMVNAGIYILSKSMIDLIEENQYLDMPSLFEKAKLKNYKLGIECTSQYWIDIGRYETLDSANKYFSQ